jgi:PAS domain S-box-containing protein
MAQRVLGVGVLDGHEWLHLVWEQTSDAMALSNAEGIVLAANPAYYRLYGYGPDEVIGKSFAVIFPSERRATAEVEYLDVFRSDHTPPPVQSMVRSKDGRDHVVDVRVSFVEEHGHREAMLSIIRDITEELSARTEATHAQHELRALVFSLSHDIKSPLAVIKGHAQVLRRQIARNTELRPLERLVESLAQIEASALRVAGLIDDLVEVATLQDGQPLPLQCSELDLVSLARETVERHERRADQHQFVIRAESESIHGFWDGPRLTRVLDNLLDNAIKYSPEGGVITVTVCLRRRPRQSAPADANQTPRQSGCWRQDGVLLVVEDTGIGIADEDLPHVFDRFRRGGNVPDAVVGRGIGLTTVAQIVHQHGGTVDLQSSIGSGTRALVWLPSRAEPRDSSR